MLRQQEGAEQIMSNAFLHQKLNKKSFGQPAVQFMTTYELQQVMKRLAKWCSQKIDRSLVGLIWNLVMIKPFSDSIELIMLSCQNRNAIVLAIGRLMNLFCNITCFLLSGFVQCKTWLVHNLLMA